MYHGKLNTLWKEIDRRMPNPMKYSADITQFNTFIQRRRLYQFLAGINETLEKERRDLLNQEPLPTIEMAYAMIRRELARRGIMGTTLSLGINPSEIGRGLAIKRRSETSFRRENGDRTHLKCTHCGGTKHTKEGCFKLIGYPQWWEEHKHRKAATKATVSRTGGKAHLATDLSGNRQAPQESTADLHNQPGNASSKGKHTSNHENKVEFGRDSNNGGENREREKDGTGERKGKWALSQNKTFYREHLQRNPKPANIPGSTHTNNKNISPLNTKKGLVCEKKKFEVDFSLWGN